MKFIGTLMACLSLISASPVLSATVKLDTNVLDKIVAEQLEISETPSISLAIVQNGQVVYTKAYGALNLEDNTPASIESRYNIGSISKQFTATALLMLADQNKLSLDEHVSKYISGLSGDNQITILQALNHTAGYNSYFMLDFMPPEALQSISPNEIAQRWGRLPLDFNPGTKWDYSNTGYTIAGLIAEKVSGQSLSFFMVDRIFRPLGMTSAHDINQLPLGTHDAVGYTRYVLELPRPSPIVGAGWEFGSGGLGMSAKDLAAWDIAMIERRLLSSYAYGAQFTNTITGDGNSTGYGLGVYVDEFNGHDRIHHDGAAYGFVAENRIYPDEKAAIVVFTNSDYGAGAVKTIADTIESMIYAEDKPQLPTEKPKPNEPTSPPPADQVSLDIMSKLLQELEQGTLNREQLTPDLSIYLSGVVLEDYHNSLLRLGTPTLIKQARVDDIGGLHASLYEIHWNETLLIGVLRLDNNSKIASFTLFQP